MTGQHRDPFTAVDFTPVGLDSNWTGQRWRARFGAGGAPCVGLGHGDVPGGRSQSLPERFVVVLTLPRAPAASASPVAAALDTSSPSAAAALAGMSLVEACVPAEMGAERRAAWLRQQQEATFELSGDLTAPPWTTVSGTLDGAPLRLQVCDLGYGWVAAGQAEHVVLGGYGRGVEPAPLRLAAVDVRDYADLRHADLRFADRRRSVSAPRG